MLFPVSDWKKFNMFFEEKPPIEAEDKINKGRLKSDLYFFEIVYNEITEETNTLRGQ